MERELNWVVIGTGVIANEMAQALERHGKHLYGIANRTQEKAEAFGKKYGVKKIYDSIDAVFCDPETDIIYLTTPHNTHYQYMKAGLQAGKHMLCEKSITLNSRELDEMSALAAEKRLVLAEAMTIYHMPLYKKLWKLVKDGRIGGVSLIQLNFGSLKVYDMTNRFFNMKLAGGAMLDIGVYAFALARGFLKSKPDDIVSKVRFAPSGADEMSGIVMTNPDGQMVVASLSLHTKQPKRCVICGEKAYIEITEYPRACEAVIVDAETGEREIVSAGNTADALWYEYEDMEDAVRGNADVMQLPYTRDVMSLMTELRESWGMRYPEEESMHMHL